MNEKAQLVGTRWVKGESMAYEWVVVCTTTYKCSLCGQTFRSPEDRPPKEGRAEVWAAFNDHVGREHPAGAAG